ncbi:hypothetical protein Q757_02880 [Oenococcus alcoholitolerans]|uniref:DNA polymerase III subunit beta n=1 Tax=Oenococcus alcoholitolerans TaxID=931074 RepID=A0ABR4XRL2_9LACO|nr:hypothetical protein Q757_02880 [Oenococcus alcoholitolerans]
MRFSLKKNELVNRLNIVNRAISGKVMIPILSGIKISAQSNGLTLIGSNSEISIKTIIAADQKNDLKIEEEGEIVVSANFFTSIIKRLSESDLQIYTEGSQIKYLPDNLFLPFPDKLQTITRSYRGSTML